MAKRYRKKIALQLFPKATTYQIEAYKERIERRSEFFRSYHELQALDLTQCTTKKSLEDGIDTLQNILTRKSTPLLRSEINQNEAALKALRQMEPETLIREGLQKILSSVTPYFIPSYFSVTFAMYPFLLELHVALEAVFGTFNPETTIGNTSYPIEQLLKEM